MLHKVVTTPAASRPSSSPSSPLANVSPLARQQTRVSRQILPKRLSTVDDVLKAWEDGDDKLPAMKTLVGNRHPNPAIRLDRPERKQLADHKRVVDAVLRLGRASFRERYEMGGGDKPRTLRDIRVVLEKEAKALKKN